MTEHLISETAWCSACRAECLVEIVRLAEDPAPVAVCLDCGCGVDCWIDPALLSPMGSDGEQRRAS